MRPRLLALLGCLLLPLPNHAAEASGNCGCECCRGREVCCHRTGEKQAGAPAPKLHPLAGVVMDVVAERSALVVKHDEIPGVMRAMTMMFLVDAGTLARVRKGDAIKAQMGRNEENRWILRDVRVVAPAK